MAQKKGTADPQGFLSDESDRDVSLAFLVGNENAWTSTLMTWNRLCSPHNAIKSGMDIVDCVGP